MDSPCECDNELSGTISHGVSLNFLVDNFLLFQHNFLEQVCTKHFLQKMFGRNFYVCKIISSKTGYYLNFSSNIFGRKFFVVAKSFPRKQVCTKTFHQHFLVETFLNLQNNFLENKFEPKVFINKFRLKIFYICKIISSKTGLNQKFWSKFFLW